MAEQLYNTTHKGVAAYMLTRGYLVQRLIPGTNPKTGKPNFKIEFNIEKEAGRKLGDEFFLGHAEGDLKDFYNSCNEVGQQIWEAREKRKILGEETATN